jgi:rhodanese-related sulfurtransferase
MDAQLQQISVDDLAQRLAEDPTTVQLIDVREPEELAIAQLPHFINLPLSRFANWAPQIQQTLDPEKETWVICHHGMRSAQMCQWLASQGFEQVRNIAGGIDAYAVVVDRSVPRY